MLDDIFGIPSSFPRDIAAGLALIHPDQREQMTVLLHEIMELHCWFDKTYRIIRNCDGQERWVHGRGGYFNEIREHDGNDRDHPRLPMQ